jgi:hypothetical protein
VPLAITWPKSRTTTRVQVCSTMPTLCSMNRMVSPSAASEVISVDRVEASTWFIPAAGSSRISSDGSEASARAISSRRWSP